MQTQRKCLDRKWQDWLPSRALAGPRARGHATAAHSQANLNSPQKNIQICGNCAVKYMQEDIQNRNLKVLLCGQQELGILQ